MNSMIYVFLENAKQAVIRGRLALSTPLYNDLYDDRMFFGNYGMDNGDTTLGFTTGDELPAAWE